MTIRPYADADADAFLALNNANVPEVSVMDEAKLADFVAWSPYMKVVEVDGDVVALLVGLDETPPYGSANFGWFKARFDSFAYVDRIAVAESERGKGWGPALYADFAQWATEVGKPRLVAEVNVEPPNPRSLRFHEIGGFQPLEEFEPTGDPAYRVVMLERTLPGSAD